MRVRILIAGLLLTAVSALGQVTLGSTKEPGLDDLKKMAARFAPTEYRVDISGLSAGDRKALAKLVEASHLIDDIFMTQYWSGDHELYAKLKKDPSALG